MSIGREGPLIEFGGALGAAVGRAARTSLNRTRVLVAVGTAAGFSAPYNTPFAATLFVLETIAGVAALELVSPVMSGTVAATLITRAVAALALLEHWVDESVYETELRKRGLGWTVTLEGRQMRSDPPV